jgi:hypothetical protein
VDTGLRDGGYLLWTPEQQGVEIISGLYLIEEFSDYKRLSSHGEPAEQPRYFAAEP